MQTETIEYQHGDATLEAYAAYQEGDQKKPAVLICHAWAGRDQFAMDKAKMIADLGYVGVAIDMYGKGTLGNNYDENTALMSPFLQDRQLLRDRITAALNLMQEHDTIDNKKIAAIGYCFGGLCVLDLARSGANIKGVVSFHGILGAPENSPNQKIKAKILALHGHDDPMVTPKDVLAFQTEMTNAGADWQFHTYGHTLHAFTNPEANDPDFGAVYNDLVAQRAWHEMKDFFKEIFS